MPATSNVDQAELDKFGELAQSWWDPKGPSKPLHELNPLRVRYIEQRVTLPGRRVVDVGCGGGILSEALAARGAQVLGIDLAEPLLAVAELHALESQLAVQYRCVSAEALAREQPGAFDLVTCMELLEHVPDPAAMVQALAQLLAPDGQLVVSTLNRNLKAYLVAVIGAEYIARILPRGTHEYLKFIRPSELARFGRAAGLAVHDLAGIDYHPLTRSFSLSDRTDVNYLAHFRHAVAGA